MGAVVVVVVRYSAPHHSGQHLDPRNVEAPRSLGVGQAAVEEVVSQRWHLRRPRRGSAITLPPPHRRLFLAAALCLQIHLAAMQPVEGAVLLVEVPVSDAAWHLEAAVVAWAGLAALHSGRNIVVEPAHVVG